MAFAAGFVMGTLRELLIAPRLGLEAGLAIEMPVMALVSFLAARWAVRRFAVPPAIADRLGMALVGLGLLVLTEEVLTRLMRGVSIFEHWAGFTPIANVINAAGLAVFLFMPLLVLRSRRAAGNPPTRRGEVPFESEADAGSHKGGTRRRFWVVLRVALP